MNIPKNIKLPTKLEKCSIIDAIIELRFTTSSDLEPVSIIGMLYSEFKNSNYSAPKELPVTEISKTNNDLNFLQKRVYQIENENFVIQLGNNALVLINKTDQKEYVGKEIFIKEFEKVLNWLKSNLQIDKYIRLGIRYVDFFDFNIFEKSQLQSSIGDFKLNDLGLTINVLDEGEFKKMLRVSNNVEIVKKEKRRQGSIIDIDTYQEFTAAPSNKVDILDILSRAHKEGKALFFTVLGEKIINELKPSYD